MEIHHISSFIGAPRYPHSGVIEVWNPKVQEVEDEDDEDV